MTENVNVRRVCLDALVLVMEDKKFLNEVLGDTLSKYQYLEKNKRSYISRMLRGTVERYIELDACISAYSSTKINKLNPYIRNILRLAIYELKYMDSIPDSATCNEYVKLAKKKAPSRLSGFVNGILRSMIRSDFDKVRLQENEVYSMPKWLYDKFEDEYSDAKGICEAFLDDNQLTIRANLAKCEPDRLRSELESQGINAKPVSADDILDSKGNEETVILDFAFAIENVDYLEGVKAFKEGLFYVQDISSMMVGAKANVNPGDTIIDVCAAPGGKSLHMAELLKYQEKGSDNCKKGHVYSYDVSENKVALIRENIARSGLDNISAAIGDARVSNPDLIEKADIVIADLPCSGLGVIGKKPDIKSRVNKEDIESLAMLQQEILNVCKDYVKPGGTLMYSTCTISMAENAGNVRKFLENNQEFELEEERQYMPSKLQDGFYIARLRKEY